MTRPVARRRLPTPEQVALTFDDGPDPTFTPLVLDELRRLDVRATFFVLGERAAAHPGIVRRIVDEGHALGSHSQTHPEPGSLGWRVVADFWRGRRAVERATGRKVPLFRPPKGYLDRAAWWGIRAARLRPWLWTIDSYDWEPGAQPRSILEKVGHVEGGDVVLLHDAISRPLAPETLDRSAMISVLEPLVRLARRRGLDLVSLPEA